MIKKQPGKRIYVRPPSRCKHYLILLRAEAAFAIASQFDGLITSAVPYSSAQEAHS